MRFQTASRIERDGHSCAAVCVLFAGDVEHPVLCGDARGKMGVMCLPGRFGTSVRDLGNSGSRMHPAAVSKVAPLSQNDQTHGGRVYNYPQNRFPDDGEPPLNSQGRLPDVGEPPLNSQRHLPDVGEPPLNSQRHLPDVGEPPLNSQGRLPDVGEPSVSIHRAVPAYTLPANKP
ncbi:MAG: hypothetical protein RL088_1883 [Verrucomicrobiota bacterium]